MTPAASPIDVAKGAGTAFLSRLGAVVEVVAQPAYVAMFGLPTYGLYTVLWSSVNLAQNIFDLGMPAALQRHVPQARDDAHANDVLRAAFLLGVAPSLGVALLVSLFAAPVADLLNVSVADRGRLATGVALFAWALPLWSIVEVGTAALRARRAFGPEIRLRIFWEQIARLILAATLWIGGATTLGLLIAHLCSLTITALATLRLLSRHYKGVRLFAPLPLRTIGSLLKTGVALLPLDIVGRLLAEAPPVVLNLMFPGAAGARASGLYAIARKLSSLAQMVRMAFSYVMAPLASASAAQGPAAVAHIYGFATRLSVVLTLPLAAVLVAAGPLALYPFGPEAAAAYPALVALVAARTIESICGQATAIQSVTGTRADPVIGSFVAVAVAAVAALLLMPGNGLTGAALAVAVGLSSGTIVSLLQLNRRQGLHPFAPPFARTTAITMIVAAAAAAIAFAATALWPVAGVAAALATIIAALWLAARLALSRDDKASLGKVARVLRLAA